MPAPGRLHMSVVVHSLRLSQHPLHALQILCYLLLAVHHMLIALHRLHSITLTLQVEQLESLIRESLRARGRLRRGAVVHALRLSWQVLHALQVLR